MFSLLLRIKKKRIKSCQHISVFTARALLYIVEWGKPGSKSQKGGNLIFSLSLYLSRAKKDSADEVISIRCMCVCVCVESYNFIRPIWQLFIELLRHGFDSGARIEISLVFHSFGCAAPSFRGVSFWNSSGEFEGIKKRRHHPQMDVKQFAPTI